MIDYADHAAHLAAIRANPDQDAPRLIYADWLEEQGDGARAAFIRVQVELANHPGMNCGTMYCGRQEGYCDECLHYRALQKRERELWLVHSADWFSDITRLPLNVPPAGYVEMRPGDTAAIVRRGFVDEVRVSLAQWTGGELCEGCYNSEEHGPAGNGNWKRSECPHCHGTGHTPGIGPALVRQQPVEAVRITDKRPVQPHGHLWFWNGPEGLGARVADTLPREIIKLMNAVHGHGHDSASAHFPTEQAAQDALSQACLLWSKIQVGILTEADAAKILASAERG